MLHMFAVLLTWHVFFLFLQHPESGCCCCWWWQKTHSRLWVEVRWLCWSEECIKKMQGKLPLVRIFFFFFGGGGISTFCEWRGGVFLCNLTAVYSRIKRYIKLYPHQGTLTHEKLIHCETTGDQETLTCWKCFFMLLLFCLPETVNRMFYTADVVKVLKHMHHIRGRVCLVIIFVDLV